MHTLVAGHRSRLIIRMLFVLILGTSLAANEPASAKQEQGRSFTITTLSSHPELVTGGDALVRIDVPGDVSLDTVAITVNGADVTATFHPDEAARTLTGLVDSLALGRNELVAASHGTREPRRTQKAILVNYPKDGPVFSGPYQTPFACEEFILPVIGTKLPKGTEPECAVERKVYYFYKPVAGVPPAPGAANFRPCPTCTPACPGCAPSYPPDVATTTNDRGVSVKYIVRMEVGSASRGVYVIYLLHDPIAEPEPAFHTPPRGWNGKLFYGFGTGCSGGWYRQGFSGPMAGEVQSNAQFVFPGLDFRLARGYAVMSSTLNNNSNNCNDVIAAEAMMTAKERFIEAYGPPRYTMGFGFSGGGIQQHMIAENYPGLLDGIVPGASFPDSLFPIWTKRMDASLLDHYFTTNAAETWTTAQQQAVTGFPQHATTTAVAPGAGIIDPRGFCPETLPVAERYDPDTNPLGVRCDIFSAYVNVFGVSPETGFARRPIDNVGVQYGLGALNAGAISIAQFLDLNEKIGGFDVDGNVVPSRTVADRTAVRTAYRSGRMTHGGGGLASIPIIDYRSYSDDETGGDGHLRYFSFALRERLVRANGHADNHVMLVEERGPRTAPQLYNLNSALLQSAFDQLDRWLDNLSRDTRDDPQIEKLVRARPAELRDGCMTREPNPASRTFVAETQTPDPSSTCGGLYPVSSFPRGVAGESIASDIIKCRLKRVDLGDYRVTLSSDERARLKSIFPTGVCDWSKRGVGQRPPKGTWLSFGPAGTPAGNDDDGDEDGDD